MEIDEIKEKIVGILHQILAEDGEGVEIDTSLSLVEGYGFDSLDLLDFSFYIEEEFDVKIGPRELSIRAKGRISEDQALDEDGYLTEAALEELRRSIPEIPGQMIKHGLRQGDVPRLLNIDVFARLVRDKLAGVE